MGIDRSMTDVGFTIDYGILIGLAAIAVAIYLSAGSPIRDFLREIKRGSVDEKIAMLYGYTLSINSWKDAPNEIKRRNVKRICSDIRSIGKIRTSIDIGQKEDLHIAKDELVKVMCDSSLIEEDKEVDRVFRLHVY